MTLHREFSSLLACAVLVSVGCSNDESGDGGKPAAECPEGTTGCPCYENGSCDATLSCGTDGKCSGGSNGGSSSGGTGGSAQAGSSAGGSGGKAGTGGSAQAGNAGSGGAGGAGGSGATGASGGSDGTGTSWSACFQEGDFASCDEACSAAGMTCGTAACSGLTWLAWGALDRCEAEESGTGFGSGECSAQLGWMPPPAFKRCCCK